ALGDAFLDVRKAAKFASVAVGASLAPELMKLARGMIAGVARVTAWIQAHRELAVMALRVGGAIVGVGAALVAMGAALKLAAFAAGGLALMITLPARALLLTVGIIKGAVVALMSLHGIMLGVGAAFVIASGAGSKALSWLGERFRDLRDVALEAWSGIADALAAGDIPTAAQILWAALKLEWVKGRQSLEGVWRGAKDAFLDVFDAIKFGGWALWADFVAGMQSMWALGLGAMGKVMTQWAISRASAINDVSVGLAVFKEMYEGKPGSESRIDAIYNLRDQMRADLEKTRTEAWSAADLVTAQALLDAAAQKEQTYLEIAKADQATGAARAEATRKELAASRAELAKAIEDYYEALAYGAQSKWLSEGGSAAMDRLRGSRLAIEGAGGAGGLGVGVSGTFAAAAVRSLEAPRLDRIAKAAEATAEAAQQTAANTRSLRDATGPQFA
ncbi:MAG: hypothetical protein MUP47_10800, partial [Phycisphaerae bacterium]|nr:hypothetical protein [Phycisphaerae bacterium]